MGHDGRAYARPFDKDRLALVPRDHVMKGAFGLLDRVQRETPEVGLAATAVMFAAFCQRLKLSPAEMHTMGLKMMRPEEFHAKGNMWQDTIQEFAGIKIAGDRRQDLPGTYTPVGEV
jgi:hypothetical protein